VWDWFIAIIRREPARVIAFIAGLGLMAGSFFTPTGGDPMSTLALWLGGAMVTLAALLPRLKSFRFGPGGFEGETRDPAEVSTELSEEGPAAFAQSSSGAQLEESEDDVDEAARWVIADAAVGQLLRPSGGPLANCELHLYMLDADQNRLLPVFEPDNGESSSEGWFPGQGATGTSWATRKYVLATGEDTHNRKYGLSSEQEQRYEALTAVASVPVMNRSDRAIAVLSASTTETGTGLTSEEGFEEHLWLAWVIGRLLIDVLEWETDDR